MRIIILKGGNKLIYKDKDNYTIKTGTKNYIDVNEAVKDYPIIKNSKHIKKCELCGKYFVKVGNRQNRRKYCSDECKKRVKSLQNQKNYYKKIFVHNFDFDKHAMQRTADYYNKQKVFEFKEDDSMWGLGSSKLSEHKANSDLKEYNYIQNELRRIGLK